LVEGTHIDEHVDMVRRNEQNINCDDRSSYKRCSQYFDVGGSSRWSSCMGDTLEVQYDFNAPTKPHDV
jgi:hypothetical protein